MSDANLRSGHLIKRRKETLKRDILVCCRVVVKGMVNPSGHSRHRRCRWLLLLCGSIFIIGAPVTVSTRTTRRRTAIAVVGPGSRNLRGAWPAPPAKRWLVDLGCCWSRAVFWWRGPPAKRAPEVLRGCQHFTNTGAVKTVAARQLKNATAAQKFKTDAAVPVRGRGRT
jgi:hypothetical protein